MRGARIAEKIQEFYHTTTGVVHTQSSGPAFKGPQGVNRQSKMVVVGDQQHMLLGANRGSNHQHPGKASATMLGPNSNMVNGRPRATSAYGNASRRNLHPSAGVHGSHASNVQSNMGMH